MATKKKVPLGAAPNIFVNLFGGYIFGSGSGYLTPIEFFGILGGGYSNNGKILPEDELMELKLNSADFARRYAWIPKGKEADLSIREDEVFQDRLKNIDDDYHNPLRHLVQSLAIPQKSNTSKARTWTTARFYPYSKELMHWDIRRKKGTDTEVQTQRNDIRGAGALAHKILRTDTDQERLARVQQKLKALLDPTLATDGLFQRLNLRNISAQNIFKDDIEKSFKRLGLDSEDILCQAIDNILSNPSLDKFTKINHMMHIIPLGIMCHALRAARNHISPQSKFFSGIVDFGYSTSELRRKSKRHLLQASKDIETAIHDTCIEMYADNKLKDEILKVALGNRNWGNYYALTAGAIGFINASVGNRYHTIKDDLLLALIAAELGSQEKEITLKEFCKRLFENWGMIIDNHAAEQVGLLNTMSSTCFENNSVENFAGHLRRLGILREFSDSTVMVGLPL